MSFITRDKSRDDGAPVEFFEFILGAETWRYTTAATDQLLGVHTYTAALIKRSSHELTGEITGRRLTVTVSGYDPVTDKYRNSVPPESMSLTIRRQHREDIDPVVAWSGVVRSVSWNDTNAEMTCEHVSMSVGRVGLYRFYQTLCSHIWAGSACGVSSEDFKTVTTVDSIDATTIGCTTAEAADYFKNGYARFNNDYRMIVSSTTTAIELSFPFYEIAISDEIEVFSGCDRALSTCIDKFDNSINFGGCPFVPDNNVFVVGLK